MALENAPEIFALELVRIKNLVHFCQWFLKHQCNNFKMFRVLIFVLLPIAFGKSIESFGIRDDFKADSFSETSEETKYNVSLFKIK